jgi:photosystem II stability/assembly factor-like uncharacterized protein
MDRWQALAPVGAQRVVSAVAVSPAYERDRTIHIGTSQGLRCSSDGGRHWRNALPEHPLFQVQAVAISAQFEQDGTILVGGAGPGILRSVDRGENWHLAPIDAPQECIITAITLCPTFGQHGIALLGTLEDGIFRSGDYGRSWSAANFGLLSLGVLALVISPTVSSDRKAYALTEDGVYISPNEGRAWKAVPDATTEDMPGLVLLPSPSFGQDGVLYVGTEGSGMWRSTDRGQSWVALPGLEDRTVNALCFSSPPNGPRLYAGTAEGEIFCSSDGGFTWRCSIDDVPSVLALSSQGPLVVAGLYDRVLALEE